MSSYAAPNGVLSSVLFIQNETAFTACLETALPTAPTSSINYITKTLYPTVFAGSQGYTTYLEHTNRLVQELAFNCNDQYLNDAFGEDSYAYFFTVPPAPHGQDGAYTFFRDRDEPTVQCGLPVNLTVVGVIRDYILSFAMKREPKCSISKYSVPSEVG
jgi:hypothetical protein